MEQKPQMIRKGKRKVLNIRGQDARERKKEKGKIHPEVVNNLN
jgi:hypothetical protein